jgi:hypothetical protein
MARAFSPWYRPRNIILGLLVLILAFIGREAIFAVTAKPGEAINYLDRARELVAAYEPPEAKAEPNAWPILLDAIDALVRAESAAPDDPALAGVPLDYTPFYSTPDKPRYNDDFSWDQVRDRAAQVVANARQTGAPERLAELARARRLERPLPVSGQMIGVLLPELGKMRQLARYNAARMALARTASDDAEFVAAYESTLALGRAGAHQAFLIDFLVGIAIDALAFNQVREHLADRPFSEATLRALLDATDRQRLPAIDLSLEGERLSCLDTIQWTHTDDGRGNGRFIPSNLTTLDALSGSGAAGSGFFGTLAQWKILNLAGLAFPSKAATTRRANEFYDGLLAYARAPVLDRRAAAFQPDAYIESLPARYMLLRLLLPAIARAVQSRDQCDMERAATRLMLAIEIYNARNGRYPESLDALIPSVLPALPSDPINGKSFGYRLLAPGEDSHLRRDGSPRPYLLYSFGVDGVDNQGQGGKQSKYNVLHTPTNSDFILNLPHEKPKAQGAEDGGGGG